VNRGNLLERIGKVGQVEARFSADQWLAEYLMPSQFQYGGTTYPFGMNQTYADNRVKEISATLPGYMAAIRQSPPAFAAEMVRALVLSEARFTFRNLPSSPTPRRTFGNRDLSVLERPWTNGTTGDLIARMEWHAGLAGNAFTIRQPTRLRTLRPDWVMIVYGSDQEPDDAAHALDGEIIGYAYCNGGFTSGNRIQTILPKDMAHWAPLPDPELAGCGMSWITPAVREIQGDIAAMSHKLQYFKNAATPNMVVKGVTAATAEQFNEIVDAMEREHSGVANAYKTLYLAAGADVTVVGAHLNEIDFKSVQGSGETRVAVLSRVPAPILGISEGLHGSSLNAGNFTSARRMFADSWIYPTLQNLCSSLAVLVNVPSDAELWFDTADMPLLREDAKDAAEITQLQASTIVALVNGGFTPESAKAAVTSGDLSLLKHTGLLSVQLQAPGTAPPAGQAAIAPPAAPALPAVPAAV
jgi:phage portal protein BeeE